MVLSWILSLLTYQLPYASCVHIIIVVVSYLENTLQITEFITTTICNVDFTFRLRMRVRFVCVPFFPFLPFSCFVIGSWGPILRQSYDIMPKLRSTYDGRLIYETFYEGRKAFLGGTTYLPDRKIVWDSVCKLACEVPETNHSTS